MHTFYNILIFINFVHAHILQLFFDRTFPNLLLTVQRNAIWMRNWSPHVLAKKKSWSETWKIIAQMLPNNVVESSRSIRMFEIHSTSRYGKEFVKDFLVRNLWRKIWFLYFFVRILKINDLHTCGTQLYFSSEFEKSMICTHVAHNYIFRQNLKNQWSAHMWHMNFENIEIIPDGESCWRLRAHIV